MKLTKLILFVGLLFLGGTMVTSCSSGGKDTKTKTENATGKKEMKDGKCGDGKCGDGKCGDSKDADSKKEMKDGKCGDGKCGDGKCGG